MSNEGREIERKRKAERGGTDSVRKKGRHDYDDNDFDFNSLSVPAACLC